MINYPLSSSDHHFSEQTIRDNFAAIQIDGEVWLPQQLLSGVQQLRRSKPSRQALQNQQFMLLKFEQPPCCLEDFLAVVDKLEQKKRGETVPVEQICLTIADHKLAAFVPSNRYFFSHGSYESQAQHLNKMFTSGNGWHDLMNIVNQAEARVRRMCAGCDPKDSVPFKYCPSPDANQPNKGLGYRALCQKILDSKITDVELARMMQSLLLGFQPPNIEAIAQAKDEPFSANHLRPRQTFMLERMPADLPLLISALFISEVSRAPETMIPSLMLLELLAAEYQCQVTGLVINFRNMLVHPELALAGKLSILDPNGVKSAIGGIHPMAHRGSFIETREDIPQDGELSWARVKASWIMMLWLQHRYPERVQVLSVAQLSELSNRQEPMRALPIASLLRFNFFGFEEYFKTFGNLDSYLNRREVSDVFPERGSHASDVFLSMSEYFYPQEFWATREATSTASANESKSRRPSR